MTSSKNYRYFFERNYIDQMINILKKIDIVSLSVYSNNYKYTAIIKKNY